MYQLPIFIVACHIHVILLCQIQGEIVTCHCLLVGIFFAHLNWQQLWTIVAYTLHTVVIKVVVRTNWPQ